MMPLLPEYLTKFKEFSGEIPEECYARELMHQHARDLQQKWRKLHLDIKILEACCENLSIRGMGFSTPACELYEKWLANCFEPLSEQTEEKLNTASSALFTRLGQDFSRNARADQITKWYFAFCQYKLLLDCAHILGIKLEPDKLAVTKPQHSCSRAP